MKTEAFGAWSKRLRTLFDKYKFVLLIILAGGALLLLPSQGEEAVPPSGGEEESFQVEDLERRLEEALSQIDGAGEVKVVLTVKSSARQILAQDGKTTERADSTDSALTTVVVSQGTGTQATVAVQQLSPEYQGALVVCSGGSDPSVRHDLFDIIIRLQLSYDLVLCMGFPQSNHVICRIVYYMDRTAVYIQNNIIAVIFVLMNHCNTSSLPILFLFICMFQRLKESPYI